MRSSRKKDSDHDASGSPGGTSPGGHEVVVASARARRVLALCVLPLLLATVLGAWVLWPRGADGPVLATAPPGAAVVDVLVTATGVASEIGTQVEARDPSGETVLVHVPPEYVRSEERRVGKEGRTGW